VGPTTKDKFIENDASNVPQATAEEGTAGTRVKSKLKLSDILPGD